jgi:hypothetical protein
MTRHISVNVENKNKNKKECLNRGSDSRPRASDTALEALELTIVQLD